LLVNFCPAQTPDVFIGWEYMLMQENTAEQNYLE